MCQTGVRGAHTWLALKLLEPGQMLGVIVDNGESAANVPKSMEIQGHEVINVEQVQKAWRIILRKSQ